MMMGSKMKMMIMGDNDNDNVNNRNDAYNASDNDHYNAKEVAKSRDAAVL